MKYTNTYNKYKNLRPKHENKIIKKYKYVRNVNNVNNVKDDVKIKQIFLNETGKMCSTILRYTINPFYKTRYNLRSYKKKFIYNDDCFFNHCFDIFKKTSNISSTFNRTTICAEFIATLHQFFSYTISEICLMRLFGKDYSSNEIYFKKNLDKFIEKLITLNEEESINNEKFIPKNNCDVKFKKLINIYLKKKV